jgi:hypothetical protein
VDNPNELLSKIEAAHLWAYFHKDWLLEMRQQLRPQLPSEYHVFVESESLLVSPEADQPQAVSLPDLSVTRPGHGADKPVESTQRTGTAAVIELDEACELFTKYTLLIRRAPENRVVAALELVSPSNKGIGSRLDREKYLRKRDNFLEAAVNFLEIDALREGERLLPASLGRLGTFERNAWTATHYPGGRHLRGHGWNAGEPLPEIRWDIDEGLAVTVDLAATLRGACEFNRWEEMV